MPIDAFAFGLKGKGSFLSTQILTHQSTFRWARVLTTRLVVADIWLILTTINYEFYRRCYNSLRVAALGREKGVVQNIDAASDRRRAERNVRKLLVQAGFPTITYIRTWDARFQSRIKIFDSLDLRLHFFFSTSFDLRWAALRIICSITSHSHRNYWLAHVIWLPLYCWKGNSLFIYPVFRKCRNEDFRERQAKETIPRYISTTEHNEKQVRNTKRRLQGVDLPERKSLIPFPNWQMDVTNTRHFIKTKKALPGRKKMKTIFPSHVGRI